MTNPIRRRKLLADIDRNGLGLEIGPSYRPIAPRRDGYRVEIIDHIDRAGLVAKYAGHGVDLDAIEDVDHVWDGRPYAELTGKPGAYDWVIASHVIEHTTDLIGFMNDCEDVLKPDGVLSLAIPDKRFTFDRYRQRSSLGPVIDARGRTRHSAGAVADYLLNVSGPDFIHSAADARDALTADVSPDIHAWCFTPAHFRLMVSDLYELGLIGLRECSFSDTFDGEFFVTLSSQGAGPDLPRLDLAKASERELVSLSPNIASLAISAARRVVRAVR